MRAYALYTLVWDDIIGFRSYYVGLRDRSNDQQGRSGAFEKLSTMNHITSSEKTS